MDFSDIVAIPWLLPGFTASLVVAFLLRGPVQRRLRTGPFLSWSLIVSLGIILSATLTPSREAIEFGAVGTRTCDLSRIGLARIQDLLGHGDTTLNVLLFAPLGAAIGLLPRSRRKAAIVVGALALPFAIEATQLLVTRLDRACQSADVIDNLTGLAVGLGIGAVTGRFAGKAGHRRR